MKARRCQGCAAPLPEAAAHESQRCPFCGLVHEPLGSPSTGTPHVQVHAVHLDGGSARRIVRWILGAVVVLVVASLVAAIATMYVGWRAARAVMPGAVALVSSALEPSALEPSARTSQQLRDLPRGYHPLDVAPPAGGYGALDAVGALPWALAIAQAWEADARLERIDVSRLRPDGTLNVQDDADASVVYRFRSPTRMERLREQARMSSSAEGSIGVWVRVRSATPDVYSEVTPGTAVRSTVLPTHPTAMRLPELAAVPAVRTLLADVPFSQGYLIHIGDEGWVWYFSTLANESKPRVRARDGAVWPYARQR